MTAPTSLSSERPPARRSRSRSEASVVRYFQERMPYGLFVPDISWGTFAAPAVFSLMESSQPFGEGSRDPARAIFPLEATHSGGVLVGEPTRLTGRGRGRLERSLARHRLKHSPLRAFTRALLSNSEVVTHPA